MERSSEERLNAVVSLVGLRMGVVGFMFVLAPRWFRNLLTDVAKLSDNEMRVIGYALVGSAAAVLAQQATRRALSAKIDALAEKRAPALAAG